MSLSIYIACITIQQSANMCTTSKSAIQSHTMYAVFKQCTQHKC